MKIIRLLVMVVGFAGSLLFTGAFIASWTNAHFISQAAREVIRYRVAQEMDEKVEALGADFLVEKAKILMKDKAEEIGRMKLLLKAKIPEIVALVASQMADLNCECRNRLSRGLRDFVVAQIADAAQLQDRLTDLIKTKYLEVEGQLTREFRIFTGTNAAAFILLTLAVFMRRQAGVHFLPVGLVLLLATLVTSYFYLFNQNWLHTIVFGDYVGFVYTAYLVFVFACLCDIVFNRAQVTATVLDATIGNLFRVLPC
ncbi:hypothetical protein [Taklimakanibacter lacteus]|uniref:hypothetical protein n=1 Tax=Taklimakanibacter lacteus TaxID=2268456 RepID=UPI0013C46AC7